MANHPAEASSSGVNHDQQEGETIKSNCKELAENVAILAIANLVKPAFTAPYQQLDDSSRGTGALLHAE
jgi:hypothetical protein